MNIIHVGSKNPTKIQAAENVFKNSNLFDSLDVRGVEVDIEEFGHPKSMKETIDGAKDRALGAFDGSVLSVGLESGLIEAPHTKTGYFETTACALYDGKSFAIGLGPSYEWPIEMTKMILNGLDGSQAFKEMGLTDSPKIGAAEGGVYVLTDGMINRTQLNELAITMALIQLKNPAHY